MVVDFTVDGEGDGLVFVGDGLGAGFLKGEVLVGSFFGSCMDVVCDLNWRCLER